MDFEETKEALKKALKKIKEIPDVISRKSVRIALDFAKNNHDTGTALVIEEMLQMKE